MSLPAPSIPHNVGYGDGPKVGTVVDIPTVPINPEPLEVDPRAMAPNHILAGGRTPDPLFVGKLELADDRLVVFWNPVLMGGRWVIWRKQWRGEWTLLTPVWNPDTHEYWPLDNRVLAIIHHSDPEFYGGVKAMWLQVRGQLQREQDARDKRKYSMIEEAWNAAETHAKIRTGYGHAPGNKSCEHSHWDKPQEKLTEKDNPLR